MHGYKVVFENPLLVASELWHFLGYEGSFIAFSWPSTPDTLAYFGDLETAALSAGSLRVLIQYLAEQTEAQRIHIIGYSAGTRVVAQALDQLALIHSGMADADGSEKWRIGQVILTGSDILATLALDLKPGDRGLERLNDNPIWSFSENYVGKLHTAIEREGSKLCLID